MKISISRGITINLGNYESARFDYGIEFNSDLYDEDEMLETIEQALKNQIKAFREKKKEILDVG